MANLYVRSTDGSDADNGTTWALAKAKLSGASAIDAAGDTIYVSQVHSESAAGAITLSFAGTLASPVYVIGGNDGAEPPTALSSAPIVANTSGDITINGSVYVYGINFVAGSGSTYDGFYFQAASATGIQVFDTCDFKINTTFSSRDVHFNIGSSNTSAYDFTTKFKNCTFYYSGANQAVLSAGGGIIDFEGCTIPRSGSAALADVIVYRNMSGYANGSNIRFLGCDFSNCAAGVSLVSAAGTASSGRIQFIDCKLPASWSGSLVSGTWGGPGSRVEMHNCDASGTNYRMWVADYFGETKSETVIVKSSGASDGTTAISWKMTSASVCHWLTKPLYSPEIVQWNDTTGASKTATIEIVHDTNVAAGQGAGASSAFQDDEVWLEVMYLSATGTPLGAWVSDRKANIMTAAADQDSSSVTWTTTGLTTPVKQKLSVTFTPQMKGYILARVVIGKASKTIYVDPLITVT